MVYLCIFVKKTIDMKNLNALLFAAAAAFMVSCGGTETPTEEVVETTTYNLDKNNSSLEWAANMSPEYGHTGTVVISDGSIEMEGDALKSGSFTIDMTTIKSTDLEEPKAGYLNAHLMGTAPDEDHPADLFFNTPEYPTATVTLLDYSNGKLKLTLNVVGKELTQEVPATLTTTENGATIKGDFSLDMSSLNIKGLQPNPEDGSGINPSIDFKLNVALTK